MTALEEYLAEALMRETRRNSVLESRIALQDQEIRALQRSRFTSATEAMDLDQLDIFDEAELEACRDTLDDLAPEKAFDKTAVQAHNRRVGRNSVMTVPENTPVDDVWIKPEKKFCPDCGAEMEVVGEKVYESLIRTVSYTLRRTHVPVFECMNCAPDAGETAKVTQKTGNMLAGTICDPFLLANIVFNKMALGVPLYRQEQMFVFGDGQKISRQAMCAWMMSVGSVLVRNLHEALDRKINGYPLINMDETTVKVLELYDENGAKRGRGAKSNAFMVVRCGVDGHGKKQLVSFRFSDNRRNATLKKFIEDYHGVLQSDGLPQYNYAEKNCDFVHLGCLVHSRRKTVEAGGKSGEGLEGELFRLYGAIFHAEGILADRYRAGGFDSDEAYVAERRKILSVHFEELHEKLLAARKRVAPKSKLGIAVNYPLERWEQLTRFMDYSFATSSNQLAEQAIRPFTTARKSFLFCITPAGADVSALYFSLIESCKALGVNAEDYLAYVFSHGASIPDGDIEAWSHMLPDEVDLSGIEEERTRIRLAKPDPERTEPYKLRGKR